MFTTLLPEGYIIDTTGHGDFKHQMCGKNTDEGAHCPNCNMPFIRLLQLDTADPIFNVHLSLSDLPYIYIYYCFRCAISEEKLYYSLDSKSRIAVVEYMKNPPGGYSAGWIGDNIYSKWQQPEYYPVAPIKLKRLTNDQRKFVIVQGV